MFFLVAVLQDSQQATMKDFCNHIYFINKNIYINPSINIHTLVIRFCLTKECSSLFLNVLLVTLSNRKCLIWNYRDSIFK